MNDWCFGDGIDDMSFLFQGKTDFNEDISSWNTASVTNMQTMFYNAKAFNQDISSWNTASVTNMQSMFNNALAFNQDISSWNTGSVTNMQNMFNYALAFNQNLCVWRDHNFPYGSCSYMFKNSGCTHKDKWTPTSASSPFCASTCTYLGDYFTGPENICISGKNIPPKLENTTPEKCAEACVNYGSGCKGIEFMPYDSSSYSANDCNLSSSATQNGCVNSELRIEFWTKRNDESTNALLLPLSSAGIVSIYSSLLHY